MSLVDRTNETIQCKMPGESALYVDVDSDSHIWPEPWVIIDPIEDDEAGHYRLTFQEAGLLHDRLGLILGRANATPDLEIKARQLVAALAHIYLDERIGARARELTENFPPPAEFATPTQAFREIRARLGQEDVPTHVAADIDQVICETGGDFGEGGAR